MCLLVIALSSHPFLPSEYKEEKAKKSMIRKGEKVKGSCVLLVFSISFSCVSFPFLFTVDSHSLRSQSHLLSLSYCWLSLSFVPNPLVLIYPLPRIVMMGNERKRRNDSGWTAFPVPHPSLHHHPFPENRLGDYGYREMDGGERTCILSFP